MFFSTLLPISVLLSLSTAQTTTTSYTSGSTSVCAAQPVLEACLASTQAIAAACATTDYQCLCQKYTDVLTCFDQCPNDSRYTGIYNTQATYCNDASVYASSTTAISRPVSTGYSWVSSTTTGSASGSSDATTTKNSVASSTSTGTGSSTASATGNSGVKNGAQMAGGLVIAAAMALL